MTQKPTDHGGDYSPPTGGDIAPNHLSFPTFAVEVTTDSPIFTSSGMGNPAASNFTSANATSAQNALLGAGMLGGGGGGGVGGAGSSFLSVVGGRGGGGGSSRIFRTTSTMSTRSTGGFGEAEPEDMSTALSRHVSELVTGFTQSDVEASGGGGGSKEQQQQQQAQQRGAGGHRTSAVGGLTHSPSTIFSSLSSRSGSGTRLHRGSSGGGGGAEDAAAGGGDNSNNTPSGTTPKSAGIAPPRSSAEGGGGGGGSSAAGSREGAGSGGGTTTGGGPTGEQQQQQQPILEASLVEQDRFEAMQRRERVFRVLIDGDDGGFHMKQVCKRVNDASKQRDKYSAVRDPNNNNQVVGGGGNIRWTKSSRLGFKKETGVMNFPEHPVQLPTWSTFASDVENLLLTTENVMCSKACSQRLEIMQERSKMLTLLNRELEAPQQPTREGGVFAEVTKVDNSVRLFRCWNAQDGLECVVDQLGDRGSGEVVGHDAQGQGVNVGEVMSRYGVDSPAGLTPERLGWQGRFVQRQPCGATEPIFSPILPIARPLTFLLQQLDSKLCQKVLRRRVRNIEYPVPSCSQAAEIRIPFYGVIPDEMYRIGRSMKVNEFGGNRRIAWFLELNLFDYPSCLPAAHTGNPVLDPPAPSRRTRKDSFLQFLETLFAPLVNATLLPEERANASLCWFLDQVGGFVFSSRSGRARPSLHANFVHPSQVSLADTTKFNDAYFEYFIWSNLQVLNSIRARRRMNTFQYRHNTAGGDVSSLISGYLLADVVANSGSVIHRYPVLQYLLGMSVVPITVSPIYDNKHGLPFKNHPLPALLHRCLKIALATEEPLHTHRDQFPINEEYATAQKAFRLSALDMTQMMRNSVLMSSFSNDAKKAWLGEGWEDGPGSLSQVSMFRFEFRNDVWKHERQILADLIAQTTNEGGGGGWFGGGDAATMMTMMMMSSNTSPSAAAGNNNNGEPKSPLDAAAAAAAAAAGGATTQQQQQQGGAPGVVQTSPNVGGAVPGGVQPNVGPGAPGSVSAAGASPGGSSPSAAAAAAAAAQQQQQPTAATSAHYHGNNVLSSRQSAAAQAQLSRVTDVEYFAVTDKRVNFPRTVIVGPAISDQTASHAAQLIHRALEMRNRYIWKPPLPWERRNISAEEAFRKKTTTFDEEEWHYVPKDSIFVAYRLKDVHSWPKHLHTLESFHRDYHELKQISDSEDLQKFSFDRIDMLEHKFRLHLATNHAIESGASETGGMGNRDFYHCTKVDTHIHMAAGMTARTMRDFILSKLQYNPDDVVDKDPKGNVLTFGAFAKKFRVTRNLTVDQMNVLADHTLFERFDNFNNHYNPMGLQELRGLLLKTDNFMNGRYFAEVIHKVFEDYSKDRYTFAENRISIYGNSTSEWGKLAEWFDTFGMASNHNKWMIQLPRLYAISRMLNKVTSFGQYIENIFSPMWDASMHPSKYPRLYCFLNHVSGFDSVDNEARIDEPFQAVPPWQWTREQNPPYPYYMYHLWANLRMLNEFRSMRGLSTFTFRPHCGESGATEHLIACFICSDLINHGIKLKANTALQYLYYLSQIGMDVSPLSNNALFLHFLQNPFPKFFRCGLNVSLSTDDPLMFHQTNEPLIEEYSIAAKVWGFSPNDMCEIARNSCLHCGFNHEWKMEKLGKRYYLSSSLGNDPNLTHLSDVRVAYRFETYHAEISHIEKFLPPGSPSLPRAMYTSEQENRVIERETIEPEPVLFSTRDQEMELLQRDMETKREELRNIKSRLAALRTKNRALIDTLTDVGIRNQVEEKKQQEELDRLAVAKERQRKLEFLRSAGGGGGGGGGGGSSPKSSPLLYPDDSAGGSFFDGNGSGVFGDEDEDDSQQLNRSAEHRHSLNKLLSPRMPPKPKLPMHNLRVGRAVPQPQVPQQLIRSSLISTTPTTTTTSRNKISNAKRLKSNADTDDYDEDEDDDDLTALLEGGGAEGGDGSHFQQRLMKLLKKPMPTPRAESGGVVASLDNAESKRAVGGDPKELAKSIDNSLGMLKHLARGTGTVPALQVSPPLFDM